MEVRVRKKNSEKEIKEKKNELESAKLAQKLAGNLWMQRLIKFSRLMELSGAAFGGDDIQGNGCRMHQIAFTEFAYFVIGNIARIDGIDDVNINQRSEAPLEYLKAHDRLMSCLKTKRLFVSHGMGFGIFQLDAHQSALMSGTYFTYFYE